MKRIVGKERGLTLIEVLVAIAVFSVVVTVASLGLSSLSAQNKEIQVRANQLARFRNGLQLMEMDFLQALSRSIRDGLGGVSPAFQVQRRKGLKIEFTRTGTGERYQGGVMRIRYQYLAGKLTREVSTTLDGNVGRDRVPAITIFSELNGFELEILDAKGNVFREWPSYLDDASAAKSSLPAGVKLRFDTARWGVLERTLLVGG